MNNISNYSPIESNNFQTNSQIDEEFDWGEELGTDSISASKYDFIGVIPEENLEKIRNGETDQLEIKLSSDKNQFSLAIEKNTAVMIKKSPNGKPDIEISQEIQNLLEEKNIKTVTFQIGDKQIIYQKGDLKIGVYSKASINEFAMRFFQNMDVTHKKRKREAEELQKAINQSYDSFHHELYPLKSKKIEVIKSQRKNDQGNFMKKT